MSTRVQPRPSPAQACPPAPRVEHVSAPLRPSGAMGCSHGWSDAALSIAQPVDPVRDMNPAPEGRRSLPTRAGTDEHPKIPSPLPGRAAEPPPFHGFRSSLRDSLHPWLHPGVPSGRSNPARASSPRLRRHGPALRRAAAHALRPSPGLRRAGIPVRSPAPGLRGGGAGLRSHAPLPSGSLGRPSDSSGRSSGSLVASADSSGRSSGPPVASAGSSGRPASPSGGRDDSSGRRDRSSVASADSPVAWPGRAPEPPPRSRLWPFRGVAGGPPPAPAHDPRSLSRTTRPSRRRSF